MIHTWLPRSLSRETSQEFMTRFDSYVALPHFPRPLPLPLALAAPLPLPRAAEVLVDRAGVFSLLSTSSSSSLSSSSCSTCSSGSSSSSATDSAFLAERLVVAAGAAFPLALLVPLALALPPRAKGVGASLGSTLKEGVKRTGGSSARFTSGSTAGLSSPFSSSSSSAAANLLRHCSSRNLSSSSGREKSCRWILFPASLYTSSSSSPSSSSGESVLRSESCRASSRSSRASRS